MSKKPYTPMKTMSDVRQAFKKKYKKMSKRQRAEIIIVLDNEPYTWNPIYIEVINKTKLSYKMLNELRRKGLL